MLGTALAPLALAGVDTGVMPCCKRRRLREAVDSSATHSSAKPAMPCHHGASQPVGNSSALEANASADSRQVSVRSLDCCCGRHCDCDRTSKTSNWARPAPDKLCVVSLLIEPLIAAAIDIQVTIFSIGSESARAPPRG